MEPDFGEDMTYLKAPYVPVAGFVPVPAHRSRFFPQSVSKNVGIKDPLSSSFPMTTEFPVHSRVCIIQLQSLPLGGGARVAPTAGQSSADVGQFVVLLAGTVYSAMFMELTV